MAREATQVLPTDRSVSVLVSDVSRLVSGVSYGALFDGVRDSVAELLGLLVDGPGCRLQGGLGLANRAAGGRQGSEQVLRDAGLQWR